jgi:hypothetical protein
MYPVYDRTAGNFQRGSTEAQKLYVTVKSLFNTHVGLARTIQTCKCGVYMVFLAGKFLRGGEQMS